MTCCASKYDLESTDAKKEQKNLQLFKKKNPASWHFTIVDFGSVSQTTIICEGDFDHPLKIVDSSRV